jgi:Protein of unknown function (DUF4236)
MSFYIRKSLKAGPFRVNLSKSGIGLSTGIPGFRIGTGPRGNYVHMGRHGVYYRTTLNGRSRPGSPGQSPQPAPLSDVAPSDVLMEDCTGATTVEMAMSSSSELLGQLNAAAQAPRLAPVAGVVLGLISLALLAMPPVGAVALLATVAGVWWLHQRDEARRSVVVFYDVNDHSATSYQRFIDSFRQVAASQRAWHVTASGPVVTTHQYKVNAGASNIVNRMATQASMNGPAVLKTNIAVPALETRTRGVYFLPDRIVVRDGKRFAEVLYGQVDAAAAATRFIEDGPVPGDSEQVGTTWKYVNVKGGPDRRYKDNRQLPVLRYGETTLTAPNGFVAIWQFSNATAAPKLAEAVAQMQPMVEGSPAQRSQPCSTERPCAAGRWGRDSTSLPTRE